MSSMLSALLEEARAGLRRVDPHQARTAADAGALLIDRNVLEWRRDPDGDHRIPELTGRDQTVILVCNEGYASSLAAATLQSIGLPRATDLDGGVRAWAAAGPPVERLSAVAG